jgi:replicative DNA helicase
VTEQVPPQNIEAEESVLGAMLVAEPAMRSVLVESGLTSKSFYFDKHREIYAAIQKVAHRDGTVDELTVGHELPTHRHYISDLAAKVPSAGNALHYARIVAHAANLRMKLAGAQEIQGAVYELDEETREEKIRSGLELIATDLETQANPTSEEELADDFFRYLDEEEAAEVMKLPFDELNECCFGGYRRGQTTVVAGWTEMGKSWWVDQMIHGFHAQGYRCAIFATEMERRERVARFLFSKTGVAMEKLLLKKLSPAEMNVVVSALPTIPFSYFEVNGWPVERICQQIILGGYDVVVIDVVNLIPGYEENQGATRILSRLMEVARKANCHVILVSHLNRARATQAKLPRPVKRDLRDSGMLETNAAAILFVHRNQDDNGEALTTGEIYFEKIRNGMKGGIRSLFDPTCARFELDPSALEQQELGAAPEDGPLW